MKLRHFGVLFFASLFAFSIRAHAAIDWGDSQFTGLQTKVEEVKTTVGLVQEC